MNADIDWVRVERDFDASVETVWNMWTDADSFSAWYGPKGAEVFVEKMDVTVGGVRKFSMTMHMPERTMTMWFIGEFKEIVEPTRLVYSESRCDEDGNILSSESLGMPSGYPETTEVIVELSKNGDTTHMTMTHMGVPAGSPGEGGWLQAIETMSEMIAQKC